MVGNQNSHRVRRCLDMMSRIFFTNLLKRLVQDNLGDFDAVRSDAERFRDKVARNTLGGRELPSSSEM